MDIFTKFYVGDKPFAVVLSGNEYRVFPCRINEIRVSVNESGQPDIWYFSTATRGMLDEHRFFKTEHEAQAEADKLNRDKRY